MARREKSSVDSDWSDNDHKKEFKNKDKIKKTRRATDRKQKLSVKHNFLT